jgi:hypothetical protein
MCKDPRNTDKRGNLSYTFYDYTQRLSKNTKILEVMKCDFLVSKGDGKCDDGNNIPECDWDGGDCCGCNVIPGHCTECQCMDNEETKFSNSGMYFPTLSLH